MVNSQQPYIWTYQKLSIPWNRQYSTTSLKDIVLGEHAWIGFEAISLTEN